MQSQKAKSHRNYSDIFHCERPQFKHSRRMSMRERAAQFSPFSALRGFEEEIDESTRRTQTRPELSQEECDRLNAQLRFLAEHGACSPTIQMTRFVPDVRKHGGSFVAEEVRVRRVNLTKRTILLQDRTERFLDDIVCLQGEFFEAMPGEDPS